MFDFMSEERIGLFYFIGYGKVHKILKTVDVRLVYAPSHSEKSIKPIGAANRPVDIVD